MKKVLIIEDEDSYVNILSQLLEPKGYKILTSNTVKNALNILGIIQPDIIIVDWNLPDKTGLEFVREVRKNKKFDKVRIVMNTIRDSDADQIEAYNCKIDFYFTKPIQPEIFMEKIKKLLGD
ncbi:MAG: response regulator [Elusimicrobia bacterium]|nr:response regulator [Elusimicrobiota bacterium]